MKILKIKRNRFKAATVIKVTDDLVEAVNLEEEKSHEKIITYNSNRYSHE